jgi:hypothetical protein
MIHRSGPVRDCNRGVRQHPAQVFCQNIRRNHTLSDLSFLTIPQRQTQRQFAVCPVHLVSLVYLISLVQSNKQNKPNKPEQPAGFSCHAPRPLALVVDFST